MESEQGKLGAAGRDRHGFRALLICLLALVVLPAHFPAEDRHLFWVVVVTLCLLVCLYMAANNRVEFVSGAVVAACAMILSWLAAFLSNSVPLALPVLFYVLFFLMVAAYLVRYLFKSDKISEEMIFASVCLYIILGLNWGFVYFLIEAFASGSFANIQAIEAGTAAPFAALTDLIYYSFVTLSTLGYGDILPISRAARSWAIIEALVGQFYLAIVVARLVGLHITAPRP